MSTPAASAASKGAVWSAVNNVMKRYENIIGLTSVHEAQSKVLEAERRFCELQSRRRQIQSQMHEIQERRKEIRAELDRTPRSEDRYLQLLTEEHAVIKNERSLYEHFKQTELAERESFGTLSSHLRQSHEKERERVERTKYWSIIGSIVGALIGIGGTTINNWRRMNELKAIVHQSNNPRQMDKILGQLASVVAGQQQQVTTFVGDLKTMLNMYNGGVPVGQRSEVDVESLASSKQYQEIIDAIREQTKQFEVDMEQIKKMIAAQRGYKVDEDAGQVVYVGPEIQQLLDETQRSLEWSLKRNTIFGVVMVYTALVLGFPLLLAACRGD